MKRFHVGLRVVDLDASVDFYTRLFGIPPTLHKPDYAKWMLEDPKVNFSLVTHSGAPGVGHLGIQVDSDTELAAMRQHLDTAGLPRSDQEAITCGYQIQNKSWVQDPQGIPWETFYTYGVVEHFGCSTTLACNTLPATDEVTAGTCGTAPSAPYQP